MKKICQYCGVKLKRWNDTCPSCGAVYEECSHCEETEYYDDARYRRDPSEYSSPYSRPMHSQPTHTQPTHTQQQYTQPRYIKPQYIQPQYTTLQSYVNTSKKTKKGFAVMLLATLMIIIIAFVVLCFFIGIRQSNGYKGTLNRYFDSFEDNDCEKYMKTELIYKILDELNDIDEYDKDELIDALEFLFDYKVMEISDEFGSDFEIDFEIVSESELGDDEIDEYDSVINMNSTYIDIEEGVELELEIEVEGSLDSDTFEAQAQMLKVDGKWVIGMLDVSGFSELDAESII